MRHCLSAQSAHSSMSPEVSAEGSRSVVIERSEYRDYDGSRGLMKDKSPARHPLGGIKPNRVVSDDRKRNRRESRSWTPSAAGATPGVASLGEACYHPSLAWVLTSLRGKPGESEGESAAPRCAACRGVPTGVRNRGMAAWRLFPSRPPETENCGTDPMNHANRDTERHQDVYRTPRARAHR